MSYTEFHLVLKCWINLTGFMFIWVCLFSNSCDALTLWEKWPTRRLDAPITLDSDVLVTLSMPSGAVIQRCSLWAEQPTSLHAFVAEVCAMFDALSWTQTSTLSFSSCLAARSSSVVEMILIVCRSKTKINGWSFRVAAPTVWNSLPLHLHNATISEWQFKSALKTHLFNLAYKWHLSSENLLKSELTYFQRMVGPPALVFSWSNQE